MATELNNRSVGLEKKLIGLVDLSMIQQRLDQMAKKTKSLSTKVKLLKTTSSYVYDPLFEVNALIAQKAGDLQEINESTSEAINQAGRWKKEWMNECKRWEQLQLSLSKQVSMRTIEPTFVRVRHIITRSQDLISRAIESLTAQRQVAEVISD